MDGVLFILLRSCGALPNVNLPKTTIPGSASSLRLEPLARRRGKQKFFRCGIKTSCAGGVCEFGANWKVKGQAK